MNELFIISFNKIHNKDGILEQFLQERPLERVEGMTLEEYSNIDKTSFPNTNSIPNVFSLNIDYEEAFKRVLLYYSTIN